MKEEKITQKNSKCMIVGKRALKARNIFIIGQINSAKFRFWRFWDHKITPFGNKV